MKCFCEKAVCPGERDGTADMKNLERKVRNMIVTVEREYGCGGEETGRRVAERLRIPFLNGEILKQRAAEEGCYEEIQSFLEEEPVNSLLYSIAAEAGELLGRQPAKQLKALIPETDFVLVGCCGSTVFVGQKDTVSVLIHGKKEERAAAVSAEEGIPERAAFRKIQKEDENRDMFYRYYTGGSWGIASDFDLTLNGIKIGPEGCTEMILEFLKRMSVR